MGYDRKYLVWALCYVVAAMCLGVYMAASHNHAQHVTHAHIALVGFVVSFIYGTIHKLWLGEKASGLAKVQFFIHHAGAVTLSIGLLLLYGNVVAEAQIEPVLAVASITVLVGAVMMLYMVLKAGKGKK